MQRRCALSLLALAGCAGLSQTALAAAEPWPSRSVRIVVPFPPGGGTDIVGRAMGQALAPRLGQAVVIDNKPGASTLIGTEAVTRAAPDGYTLLVSGSTTFSVNPALKPRLNYDPFKDLSAVAVLARAPLVVVVPAQSPFKTLPELLNAARRQPGSVRYATYGSATAPHLAGLLLGLSAGVNLQDIPYKGSAQVSTALMSGEVEATFDTVASAGPLIKAGKVRALATPSRVRVSSLPQVGLPDSSFERWYAMAAPAGTPAPVLERLGRELRAVMALPEVQKQFRAQALEPVYQDPAAMTRLMEQEITQFRAAAARAHLTLE